jgi:hypothetical protein
VSDASEHARALVGLVALLLPIIGLVSGSRAGRQRPGGGFRAEVHQAAGIIMTVVVAMVALADTETCLHRPRARKRSVRVPMRHPWRTGWRTSNDLQGFCALSKTVMRRAATAHAGAAAATIFCVFRL